MRSRIDNFYSNLNNSNKCFTSTAPRNPNANLWAVSPQSRCRPLLEDNPKIVLAATENHVSEKRIPQTTQTTFNGLPATNFTSKRSSVLRVGTQETAVQFSPLSTKVSSLFALRPKTQPSTQRVSPRRSKIVNESNSSSIISEHEV